MKNYPFHDAMEQSQIREEIMRLNEELSSIKAELKIEREKLASNQQLEDKTPRVSKSKIDNISDLRNDIRLFLSYQSTHSKNKRWLVFWGFCL